MLMGTMKLRDISTLELERMVHDAERELGRNSRTAEMLRRELERRQVATSSKERREVTFA